MTFLFHLSAWGTKYKFEITSDDFSSIYMYDNWSYTHTSTAVCPENPSKTFQVEWTSNNVMYYSSYYFTWKKGEGMIYNNTKLENLDEISIETINGDYYTIYYGNRMTPYNYFSGSDNYFQIIATGNNFGDLQTTKVIVSFTIDDTPPTISLKESENNNATLSTYSGQEVNVELSRSLTANMWNAICLPFSMTTDQMTSFFGGGYDLQEFNSVGTDNGGTQLNFSQVIHSFLIFAIL